MNCRLDRTVVGGGILPDQGIQMVGLVRLFLGEVPTWDERLLATIDKVIELFCEFNRVTSRHDK